MNKVKYNLERSISAVDSTKLQLVGHITAHVLVTCSAAGHMEQR